MTKTTKHQNRPNVALLYVRVSTAQQAASGLSLEQQEAQVRAAASAAGYDEVEVICEAGKSGKSIKARPALTEALARLKRGDAAALFVSKLDRLGRSVIDVVKIADLADRQGWRLVALDLNLDTSTPTGRLVLSVLAATAEFERGRICERHADWHAAKRAQGIAWGVTQGPKAELPDEVRLHILELHQAGQSLGSIARDLNERQVPTARGGAWYPSTIRHVLRSPSLSLVSVS